MPAVRQLPGGGPTDVDDAPANLYKQKPDAGFSLALLFES